MFIASKGGRNIRHKHKNEKEQYSLQCPLAGLAGGGGKCSSTLLAHDVHRMMIC